MYNFFAYLSRMKHIKRWGLMRNTREENVAEHSFYVAMLAHALAQRRNATAPGSVDAGRVLELALYHEAGEVFTGDLATPIKYFNPRIRAAYAEIEDICLNRLLELLPPELRPAYAGILIHEGAPEYALVRAADKLCAYIKCIEELKGGNLEFEPASRSIAAQLIELALPEVDWFMEQCLPGYALTLDELNDPAAKEI